MWPLLLDLSKDECKRMLRRLELEAYSSVITAFRAQGDLSKDKKKVLQDLSTIMGISTERHRAEIRRAVNDEHLATIADQVGGCCVSSEWAMEGRRLVPLMPRLVPQTAFSALANSAANVLAVQNSFLPTPAATSNKREPSFNTPATIIETSIVKSLESISKSAGNTSGQDVSAGSHMTLERENPNLVGSMTTPDEIYAQQMRFTSLKSGANKEGATSQAQGATQNAALEPLVAAGTTGNVAIPARTPIGTLRDGEKGRRYRRSSSADTQAAATIAAQKATQVPNPHAQGAMTKGAAVPPTGGPARSAGMPVGGTSVSFAMPGSNPKIAAASAATGSAPPQKVILVSTPGSNLPSSLLQRSLGLPVPVVKTVTTTGSTLSATLPTGKSAALAAPPSAATSTTTTTSSTSCSSASSPLDSATVSPSFPAPMTTAGLALVPLTTAIGPGITAGPAPTAGSAAATTSAAKVAQSQSGKAAVQNTKGHKRILVPVTSQSSSTSQTLQIKAPVKPSIHIKPEGLKFITQSLPLPAGAKLIPKSGGGSGAPIVVVTKSTLTQSSQSTTRLVNVLTTQTSSGKLMTPTTLTVSKASGTPTFVSVGSKGKHAALVKMSPAMSLSGTGGKPNVIVVQKAHLMSHATSGNSITVSASSLSAAAQTVLKSTSGSTFTYEDKVPRQSTVLADILQAAGIIEGTSTSEALSVDLNDSQTPKTSAGLSPHQATSDVPSRVPAASRRKSGNSATPATKCEPKQPVMNLVVNAPPGKGSSGRPAAINLQQIRLPFDIQDAQIVEIQDSRGLVTPSGKLNAETLNLFQQSGLQITTVPPDSTNVKPCVEAGLAVDQTMEVVTNSSSGPVGLASKQPLNKLASATRTAITTQAEPSLSVHAVPPARPNAPVPVLSMTSLVVSATKVDTDRPTKPDEICELDPITGLFYPTSNELAAQKSSDPRPEPVKNVPVTARASTSSDTTVRAGQPNTPAVSRLGSTGVGAVVTAPKPAVLAQKVTPSAKIGGGTIRPKAVVSMPSGDVHAIPEGKEVPTSVQQAVNRQTEVKTASLLAPAHSIIVAPTELPTAAETGPKLPYRLATYSREDVASRKKLSPNHTTEAEVRSSTELPLVEDEIKSSATAQLQPVVLSPVPLEEHVPMAPPSVIDNAVGAPIQESSLLTLANAVRDPPAETAALVTSSDFQQPTSKLVPDSSKDGDKETVAVDVSTLLPLHTPNLSAVSEIDHDEAGSGDPDHLLFITAFDDGLVPCQSLPPLSDVDLESTTSADPTHEFLMVEVPTVENNDQLSDSGNDEPLAAATVGNPNVTVEVLPSADFEFTADLSHHLEADHVDLAPVDVQVVDTPVVETEVIDSTVDPASVDQLGDVYVDEVTFADDGLTTGVEETVVTVELDCEMDAVGERRWKWPLSPDATVPTSPSAEAEGGFDAEMQRVLANLERHGGTVATLEQENTSEGRESMERGLTSLLPSDDADAVTVDEVAAAGHAMMKQDTLIDDSADVVEREFPGDEAEVAKPSTFAASSHASIQDALDPMADLHVSGSSVFMVTESARIEECAEPDFTYDTECTPHSPSDVTAGDGGIHQVAETIVAESSTSRLVVDSHIVEGEIQETPILEGSGLDELASSVASSSAERTDESQHLQPPTSCQPLIPCKRKRKQTSISSPEENLNIPHLSGWARSAMGLLLRVMKFRGARKMKGDLGASHWFLHPVTAEEAPGYHQIIQLPMDFSTIKTRLETLCYHTISEFHVDMMQVKTNCELYNPPEHEARKDCEEVFNFYVQEYDRLIEKWQKAHLFTSSQKRPKLDVTHGTVETGEKLL